jgi:methanogenic corrinoid protein MtbC1
VESGHSIGMIAVLPTEELDRLASSEEKQEGIAFGEAEANFLNLAMRALHSLDASAFEAVLVRASVVLGVDALVDEVVVPLLREVGRKWEAGELSIAQEHLASALVRTHLERTRLSIQPSQEAPKLIAATPTGQHHEIGAMLAAIVAARMDWDVTYLGPNLPAEEIAEAASRTRASAVALSLVHPLSDATTEGELRRTGALLGKGCVLLVGGEAAPSYANVLEAIEAKVCPDMVSLRERLNRVRPLHSQKAGS